MVFKFTPGRAGVFAGGVGSSAAAGGFPGSLPLDSIPPAPPLQGTAPVGRPPFDLSHFDGSQAAAAALLQQASQPQLPAQSQGQGPPSSF